MKVRIGIVAWNCADDLRRCLAAVPAALGDLDAEVVVVDNASRDASAEVAEQAGVRLVRSHTNLGYARGMNRALGDTDASVLIALNPDTVPPPDSLARLVEELDRRPDVAVVVPLLRHADGRIQHSVHRFPSVGLAVAANLVPPHLLPRAVRDHLWLAGAVREDRTGHVDWAIGAVHVLRASAVPDPPYRERWFMYVEDVDLCARVADAGWRVWFAAGTEVTHVASVSAVQAFADDTAHRWWNETYEWYGGRHGGPAVRAYAAVNALGALIRLAVVGVVSVVRRREWSPQARWRMVRRHAGVALHGRPVPLPPPGRA